MMREYIAASHFIFFLELQAYKLHLTEWSEDLYHLEELIYVMCCPKWDICHSLYLIWEDGFCTFK